jgi:hypothetical protein
MRDALDADDETRAPTPIERRLRAIDPPPLPEDLLDRCLSTIAQPDPAAPGVRRRPARWRRRLAAAAAAAILLGAVALLTRPNPADAAGLLRAVQSAGIRVASSHTVTTIRAPDESRHIETWYVRGRGRRDEIRVGEQVRAIVVRGSRWEFRWDVPGRLVAAWSTELNAAHQGFGAIDGVVQDGEAMIRWAESHRAEVRVEADTIGARKLRRISLNWPGPPDGGFLPRRETIWCDPETLRPVKTHVEFDDSRSIDTEVDYPAPEAIPEDLFAFHPPSDVTIEINDPDLGRQIYSEARTGTSPPRPQVQPGGQR